MQQPKHVVLLFLIVLVDVHLLMRRTVILAILATMAQVQLLAHHAPQQFQDAIHAAAQLSAPLVSLDTLALAPRHHFPPVLTLQPPLHQPPPHLHQHQLKSLTLLTLNGTTLFHQVSLVLEVTIPL